MPVYNGNTKIKDIYYGGTKIKEAYYGSTKVYSSFTPQTITFNYTGAVQTWTVPAGVTKLIVDCVGAAGGGCSSYNCNTSGGKGGRVQCNLAVTPGQTLYIYVGQVGCRGSFGETVNTYTAFNGGGTTYHYSGDIYLGACGGGGASDIRIGGTALANRKVVSGAGGGGVAGIDRNNRNGGNGGGLTGQSVSSSHGTGAGGTQTKGGYKGGTLGNGGDSIGFNSAFFTEMGGSGGGGYYGGGGSGAYISGSSVYEDLFGGGGGSSYTDPNLCSNVVHTQGYSSATGNGWITITTSNQ